jgi:Flp pilus assembly pilin Flp
MKMARFLAGFLKREDGAVTIDWVVLCAGVVALAVGIIITIEAGAVDVTNETGQFMRAQDPNL